MPASKNPYNHYKNPLTKKLLKIISLYGIQIAIIFFIANLAVVTIVRYRAKAQFCMTSAQIDADTRCLYIVRGEIYKKGTKPNKHHSHLCGSDVSSTIPSYHVNSASKYLLPNYVGPLCSGNQTPGPTPTITPPLRTPTRTPTASSLRTPTAAAIRTPTATTIRTPSPGNILTSADINADRVINIVDIGIVIDNYARNPIPNIKADVNSDGSVNIVDIGLIIDHYGKSF